MYNGNLSLFCKSLNTGPGKNMELQFTPFALLFAAASIIALLNAFIIWRRRPGPGVNAFVAMMLGAALWTSAGAMELLAANLGAKILFVDIVYIGVVIVAASWFLFALSYTGKEHLVTRRNIILLTIMPVLTMLAIISNPLHELFWTNRAVAMQDSLMVTDFDFGPLFWVHTAYSYMLIILGAGIMLRAVIRSPQLYRGQIGLILVGGLAPFIGNMLFLSALNPLPDYVDLTSFTYMLSGIPIGWALYRFRLMDIVPVAREIVVENMVDGVLVVDSETRIVDINKAAIKILNLPGNTVIGKPLLDVWTKEKRLLLQFQGMEDANREVEIEVDGELRTYNVRLSPLRNRRGDLTGRIANLNDITSIKEINRELELARQKADEATRLKSDFLATMSHELRTPLNAVIGYSELMLSGMVGELSDKHYDYTDRVTENAKYLLGLINDILDISKIEAGRMELSMQPFNLKKWTDEIVAQHQILADEKKLDFRVEIDDKLPEEFLGDAPRLRQVTINLLSNAFKFTHKGTVKLKLSKHDTTTWSIIVSDTGIGISPHKQETIFEEFQQADNSSTREYGGTGLGLAIVRRFILMMGGHIRLTSSLGEGSTFTIVLPLLTKLPEEARTQPGITSA